MEPTGQSGKLLQRLRTGDERAAAELFARYARRLTGLAEQHLSRKLAGREDSADLIQSVFRTFFRRNARGEFQIDSSGQLWRLLVKITLLKARARGRHHTAKKRDMHAEVGAADTDWLASVMAEEPGPAEAVALVDQIDYLLRGLPPLYCHVLQLRLQGVGVTEIAQRLEVSRQTIYRALELLQKRLAASNAE